MKVYKSIKSLLNGIALIKKKGKTIGFVPTMGSLHEGHLSLIRKARKDTDCVAVSIFVNPIQFGPKEDFKQYPRDIGRDTQLCKKTGADIVFVPTQKIIYENGFSTYVNVEDITNSLCGARRPNHFRGVTTIVAKLFNIVKPDIAYFGQKDAQQAIIIKKMVKDLDMPVKVKIAPTVREKDGLAMSSRNTYLNASQRRQALVLQRSLRLAKDLCRSGEKDTKAIIKKMRNIILKEKDAKIDYVSIVGLERLEDIDRISKKALAAVAVKIGNTRLIDNTILN